MVMPGYEDDETPCDTGRSLQPCEQADPPTATRCTSSLRAREFRTILGVFLLAFLSNFSYYCSELPLLRLVEQRICETYYAHEGAGYVVVAEIDEALCKIPSIQNQLARFVGYKTAFDAIPRISDPHQIARVLG